MIHFSSVVCPYQRLVSLLRQLAVCMLALAALTTIVLSQTAQTSPPGSESNGPSSGAQENTAKQTSQSIPFNTLDVQEKAFAPQLERIGNIKVRLSSATSAEETLLTHGEVFLTVENPPMNVVANYRFPGEIEWHPLLASNGISKRVPVPKGVKMVLVELIWCGGCNAAATASKVGTPPPNTCPQPTTPSGGSSQGTKNQAGKKVAEECKTEVVFFRDLLSPEGNLLPGFIVDRTGLRISEALLNRAQQPDAPSFVLNGSPITDYLPRGTREYLISENVAGFEVQESVFGWTSPSVNEFHIQRCPDSSSCRPYAGVCESLDVQRPMPVLVSHGVDRDNGITVAPSKVFDPFTLRQMLAATASQLAGVSGFTQANITSAIGNLQGITRDTSYLSAQVTTVPTPIVSSVAVNGITGTNTQGNTLTLTNGQTGATTTLTCPPGTLPGIGTSGVPACTLLVGGSSPTGAGNTTGGSSTLGTTGSNTGSTLTTTGSGTQTSNQQNTVTTTSGGQAGTVAPIPVSTPLAAPSNVGVSASDVLAEQVQLNSQITTLRLLLQGAVSDQYLVKESRAISTRQQTTVGFAITLDPPQRYRHAVAEVKVWIDSPRGVDQASVMNLLPADKTYNVAKITSNQNAFGAGAVVEAVNLGVSTGKSKDRLYLVKDTDTVAFQYKRDRPQWPNGAERVPRSAQEHIADALQEATKWQALEDACADDPDPAGQSLVFGWQFRPVLGADYVQAGQRLLFAQLALPIGLGERFAPVVHIQTRWREYDAKRRVVGPVYEGSCSISEDPDPITVLNALTVHDMTVDDEGNGVLKVSATGNFFSSGYAVLNGSNVISPTTFDGKSLQFFAPATSLLLSDDLKLLAEDGRTTDLGLSLPAPPGACGISHASVTAAPRPDGTSFVEVSLQSGPKFALGVDKAPHPLILLGSQVYGLHETPFIGQNGAPDGCVGIAAGGFQCKYHFIAPTDALTSARVFTVRDLVWKEFKNTGPVQFEPSFASLSILGTKPSETPAVCPSKTQPKSPSCTPPALFTLSGLEFQKLQNLNCGSAQCLEVFQGLNRLTIATAGPSTNFHVVSRTTAVIQVPPPAAPAIAYTYKSLRLIWHVTNNDAIEWDLDIPEEKKASITAASILNVGDSVQLVFNGVELTGSTPRSVLFDNMALDPNTYKYDKTKKTLTALITTAMTSKPGHKELTVTDSVASQAGKPPKQLQLPFDVTKR